MPNKIFVTVCYLNTNCYSYNNEKKNGKIKINTNFKEINFNFNLRNRQC